MERPTLHPSDLGKLIQLEICPRYYKFNIEETGFDSLGHDKNAYVETVSGGNIVEKIAGDQFELELLEEFRSDITVINLDELTLRDAATITPQAVQKYLNTRLIEEGSIQTGQFVYSGYEASDINLSEPPSNDDIGFTNAANTDNPLFPLKEDLSTTLIQTATNQSGSNTRWADIFPPRILSGNTTHNQGSSPLLLYQPALSTSIANWFISGEADFVFIWPLKSLSTDHPRIRVIDAKLANDTQTNHQIQTACYTLSIDEIVDDAIIEGGVLTQKDDYWPPTPDTLPKFNRSSREVDIKRLLSKDGQVTRLATTQLEELQHQLNQKCSACQYNEMCYSEAVENGGIELLGIDRGTQTQLSDIANINSLEDLAQLAEPADISSKDDYSAVDPRKHKDNKPGPVDKHTYNRLAEIPGIGNQLPELIQQAQAYLGAFNPDHQFAYSNWECPHLTNTGTGDIPDDSFILSGDKSFQDGSMVRAYINVQYDHIRDSIVALSSYVTATASEAVNQQAAIVPTELPENTEDQEYALLAAFGKTVYDQIQTVAKQIEFGPDTDQEQPFIHFYTYTEHEKQFLIESLNRYAQSDGDINYNAGVETLHQADLLAENEPPLKDLGPIERIRFFRDLITGSHIPDKEIISAIKPDLEQRFALKTPTNGLVNVVPYFYPDGDEAIDRNSFYKYTPDSNRNSPNKLDIRDVFGYRMFNNTVSFESDDDSLILALRDTEIDSSQIDGQYPTRVRTAAQIPLGYIWGATGKLSETRLEKAKSENPQLIISPFVYRTRDEESQLSPGDLYELIVRFPQLLCHVEQSIPVKEPIKVIDNK